MGGMENRSEFFFFVISFFFFFGFFYRRFRKKTIPFSPENSKSLIQLISSVL